MLACALLVACGKKSESAPESSAPPPPPDEATKEQRLLIESTLGKIEAVAADLGHARRFRSIPVIVSSDKQYLGESNGACVRRGNKGRFILLKPAVLDFEAKLPEDTRATSLFPVLLHEIGHCYFGRKHDNAQITSEGFVIELAPTGHSTAAVSAEALDASVMQKDKLVMDRDLGPYYVAELMGLARDRSVAEVASYTRSRLRVSLRKKPTATPLAAPAENSSAPEASDVGMNR